MLFLHYGVIMSICERLLAANKEKRVFLLALFAGMVLGASLVFLFSVIFLRCMILPEYECTVSYEEMIKIFPERVAKNPLWICRRSHCGMPYMKEGERVSVFELCSSKYAAKLLKDPQSRKMGSMIPCKVAIYEKEGKVYLCRLDLSLFTLLVGGNTFDVFSKDIIPEQKVFLHGLVK